MRAACALPRKKRASQGYLYYNADAPLEYFEMELEDASRAGKPATRSSSSTDDGAPPSKKPKPRFNAHGKYTTVKNALETALADFVRSVAQQCSGPGLPVALGECHGAEVHVFR